MHVIVNNQVVRSNEQPPDHKDWIVTKILGRLLNTEIFQHFEIQKVTIERGMLFQSNMI